MFDAGITGATELKEYIRDYNKTFQFARPELRRFTRNIGKVPLEDTVRITIRELKTKLYEIRRSPEIENIDNNRKIANEAIKYLNKIIIDFNQCDPQFGHITPVMLILSPPKRIKIDNVDPKVYEKQWWEIAGQVSMVGGGLVFMGTGAGLTFWTTKWMGKAIGTAAIVGGTCLTTIGIKKLNEP